MEAEERGKTTKIHDLWIDIGAKNKADAEKVVGIGDYAVLDVGLIHLRNQLVAGRGFDDRAGAFVVVETLRKLKGRDLNVAVYGVNAGLLALLLHAGATSLVAQALCLTVTVPLGYVLLLWRMKPNMHLPPPR